MTSNHTQRLLRATALFVFAVPALMLMGSRALGQTRTTLDALGKKDVRENYFVASKNGGTYFTTSTAGLEDAVKSTIAAQKSAGFKKAEEATFLATVRNPLEGSFEVKKGYVYSVAVVHGPTSNTMIARLRDLSGAELSPEVSHAASGPFSSPSNPTILLADYTPAANGTAVLGIGMMMAERADPAAVQILVFKKKA